MVLLAPDGLALAGFHDDRAWGWGRRLAELWPDARLLVDAKPHPLPSGRDVHPAPGKLDAPLLEPTLDDYLRLLRVKADQVQLTGDTQWRPIGNVFVDLETLPKELARQPSGRPRRPHELAEASGEAAPERLDEELELREQEQAARSGTVFAGSTSVPISPPGPSPTPTPTMTTSSRGGVVPWYR